MELTGLVIALLIVNAVWFSFNIWASKAAEKLLGEVEVNLGLAKALYSKCKAHLDKARELVDE